MTEAAEGLGESSWLTPNPRDSFGTDLELATLLVTADRCLCTAPLTDGVRTSTGSAALGLLVLMVDIAGSYPALANCRPDWTATQDLALHATGWLTEGPVVTDLRLVRMGQKVVVIEGEIYDGHGIEDFEQLRAEIDGEGGGPAPAPGRLTLTGRTLMTFVRLPSTAARGVDRFTPADWVGEVRRTVLPGRPEGTMRERANLEVVDAATGVVEVGHSPYLANSIGTILGAVQALAIETAAEAMRPDLVATDVQMHFLSQVRTGPARTHGIVVRDAADHSIIRVELVDAGADDRLGAVATVTLQRPPT